jgi:DNA adenine methylase
VYFDTGRLAAGQVVLGDLNGELVNLWKLVRDQPLQLLDALTAYDGKDTEAEYYEVRGQEQPSTQIRRAARFLYLNQTAWNGLWRVNRWGRFNVPWGARPFRGVDANELLDISSMLAGADIREADFRCVLTEPGEGDFVYLDPPYLPISDTSKFHGYTEKRFRRADLVELATLCEQLTARKVHWVLSNRDTPLVRELFSHAEIVALTTRRSVAAQNRRDVEPIRSPEVIVVGRP